MKRVVLALFVIGLAPALFGCSLIEPVFAPQEDTGRPDAPSLPLDLWDVVETFGEFDLPDLSELPNLPQLDALPFPASNPGTLDYRGPVQITVEAGERVLGTDILLLRTGESVAVFEIAGLRSIRRVGDSLDYDGGWPGLPGVTYNARLRIYQVGDGLVRIAGVHQLSVPDADPFLSGLAEGDVTVQFPFVASVSAGERIPGATYGYAGVDDRGALLTGMAEDEYPFRKIGDSVEWRGRLRDDIPLTYSLRIIHYDNNALQAAGVATLQLPAATGE